MIEVTVFEQPDGRTTGFRAKNHSNQDIQGNDIVCAGVSTVFEVLREGIKTAPDDAVTDSRSSTTTDWTIVIEFEEIPQTQSSPIHHLFKSCRSVLARLSENHPENCSMSVKLC